MDVSIAQWPKFDRSEAGFLAAASHLSLPGLVFLAAYWHRMPEVIGGVLGATVPMHYKQMMLVSGCTMLAISRPGKFD